MENYIITSGNPYPLGASVISKDTVNVALVSDKICPIGIVLTNRKSGKSDRIELGEANRIGNIYCATISGIDIDEYEYSFFEDENEYCDPYGRLIVGNEKWGKTPQKLSSAFVKLNDKSEGIGKNKLMTDYSDSIMYLLHVRGFTKHKSSGVENPGTFEGIVEKIPYLKDLGITAIELMPAYEFVELEKVNNDSKDVMDSYASIEPKLNYWGYKKGFYFSPKASYAAKGRKATESFYDMVEALHTAGIEVIMQFYFPNGIKQAFILEVLKYWVLEYHIDGFHLLGDNMPLALLGTEPLFANTKLMYYHFPVEEIYGAESPRFKNLAVYNDEYMINFRRFLKSDEGQIGNVIRQMKEIDPRLGKIHYMTNCNGFTLMDLVSYDRKHNEDNGENNRDGNPYNASWNCGFEGPTTRKTVSRLRKKQIKNAIAFNLLTQSTPMILAGDEFGNSQKGNNNPYCIDNKVTWLNWNDLNKNNDIFTFYKTCIALRHNNRILHMNRPFKMTDYLECGYPDISLHGEEAWKVETDDLTRHFAMLYSGGYANVDANGNPIITAKREAADYDFIYIAINMHWTDHEFALPKIDAGKRWYAVINTAAEDGKTDKLEDGAKKVIIKDRSIVVLVCK